MSTGGRGGSDLNRAGHRARASALACAQRRGDDVGMRMPVHSSRRWSTRRIRRDGRWGASHTGWRKRCQASGWPTEPAVRATDSDP